MYELIISDFSRIENIISFLSNEGMLENLKNDFGTLKKTENINQLYDLLKKAENHNIPVKIIESKTIQLPPLIKLEIIEIKDEELIFEKEYKLKIKEAQKLILHFIRTPKISRTPFIIPDEISDLISFKPEIFLEIITEEKRFLIHPDCFFKTSSKIFDLSFSSEKNVLNLFDYITFLNHKITKGPVAIIYKTRNNYVKYFIKDCFDDKELLWTIKTENKNT